MLLINFPIIKEFNSESRLHFQLLNKKREVINDSIQLEAGSLYGLRGDSGSGKTTFMNILSLLTKSKQYFNFQDGKFEFGKEHENQSIDRASCRKSNFSFIFQDPHIINIYSVKENLQIVNKEFDFSNDLSKISSNINNLKLDAEIKSSVLKKIGNVIKEKENHSPFSMSGGEKQMLSFIRAMIKPSNILFADEPWAAMDGQLKTFIEFQLHGYLTDSDIFAFIRNREVPLLKKKLVIMISHSTQNRNNKDKILKEDKDFCHFIGVENHTRSEFTKYDLCLNRYSL